MNDDDQQGEGGLDPNRTLALSDGIFAIAMTLLAFQIQPPDLPTSHVHRLASALAGMSSRYYVYLLSFMVIGLFWLAHHRFFRYVDHVDDTLVLINLLFLMVVAALPFPSAVLGQYGTQRVAVIVYASAMAAGGALLTVLWVTAQRHRLLSPTAGRAQIRDGMVRGATTAAVFAFSIPVAMGAPGIAPYMWAAVLPVRLLPAARRRRSTPAQR